MGKENSTISRNGLYDSRVDRTDWDHVKNLSDRDIARAISDDPDAAPLLDREWFEQAKIVLPEPKKQMTLRIDSDVVTWFKSGGKGYQSRMNAVLRQYMEAKRRLG